MYCVYNKSTIMEQTLTPEESLQIIQKSILNSRKNMRDGSFFYLLWGWTLILSSLTNYFLINYLIKIEQYEGIWIKSLLTWLAFVTVAMVIQFTKISRASKVERVKTHLDRYIMIIWMAAGILMTLMVFLSSMVDSTPTPFILGVTAMAAGVTGLMVKFRPVFLGAIVFFIAAVVASFLNGTDQLLVFAAAIALGYLIPGYILRKIKSENNV